MKKIILVLAIIAFQANADCITVRRASYNGVTGTLPADSIAKGSQIWIDVKYNNYNPLVSTAGVISLSYYGNVKHTWNINVSTMHADYTDVDWNNDTTIRRIYLTIPGTYMYKEFEIGGQCGGSYLGLISQKTPTTNSGINTTTGTNTITGTSTTSGVNTTSGNNNTVSGINTTTGVNTVSGTDTTGMGVTTEIVKETTEKPLYIIFYDIQGNTLNVPHGLYIERRVYRDRIKTYRRYILD